MQREITYSVNELRDPYIYEINGALFLFIAVALEQTIGIVQLKSNYNE